MNPRDDLLPDLLADRLRRGGEARLRLAGLSLFPWILPGAVLVLRGAHDDEPRPGQAVVVRRGARLICHEVDSIDPAGTLTLRRFGGPHPDAPDPADALVGIVSRFEWGPFAVPQGGPVGRVARGLAARLQPIARIGLAVARRVLPAPLRRRLSGFGNALGK